MRSYLLMFMAFLLSATSLACIEPEEDPKMIFDAALEMDGGPWLLLPENPSHEISLGWLSNEEVSHTIHYGAAPDALNQELALGRGAGLWRATLSDLSPGQRYYYALERGDEMGEVRSFRTLEAHPDRLRVVVVGDMQPRGTRGQERILKIAEEIETLDPDLVVQVGDITETGGELESWRWLMPGLRALADEHPLVAVPGNHDVRGDDGRAWRAALGQPESPEGMRVLDVGDLHLVVLDTTISDDQMDQEVLPALAQDLEEARAAGKWVFVTFHHSVLSSGTINMDFALQERLVPIFDKAQVDGVFYGHDHMYEHYLYTYGGQGLVHDPDHLWSHHPVHYWLLGGGGADLESDYGLATQATRVETRTWYDLNLSEWVEREVEVRPWNPDHLLPIENEIQGEDLAFLHDQSLESYQDDLEIYGHDLGVNAFHLLVIDLEGEEARIRAVLPGGETLSSLDGERPQEWILRR